MAKEVPLAVVVPAADRDKPAWVKVGVIAGVCFVLGIAWPRLVGVRIGPAAPGEAAASASAHAAGRAVDAPPASVAAKSATPLASAASAALPSAGAGAATTPSAASASAAAQPPNISVQKGSVLSCKTEGGETKRGNKDCGPVPGIDMLVTPRLRKIATCSGVEGQSGKLSLVVNADFSSGRFWYDVGKSSTVQNVDAISNCLKTTFHGTSTTQTAHEHPRYTVLYNAMLTPPNAASANASASASASAKEDHAEKAKEAPPDVKEEHAPPPNLASGEAQVAWEVALVRDAPKTGGLVSRLPRGTKVKVGAAKDGWYQIKFGDAFANEGWVYRGAIGR
jgi:hypothetical protein